MGLAMKRIYMIFIAALAFAACDSSGLDQEQELVEVRLSFETSPSVKAESPLIPDVENLIYDLWILQYDKMGLLIDAGTSHYRAGATGLLAGQVTATLAVGEGCTLCVLANIGSEVDGRMREWPQTLTDFKRSTDVLDVSDDISAANDGSLSDMPLSGYWEGDITSGQKNIQVSLGRMFSRINLVVNNNSGTAYTVKSLTNVATKVYAFPSVTHEPLPADAYTHIDIDQTVAAGDTKEMYFYMAPNFNDATGTNAVRLNIEGKDPVILCNGAPSDFPRDYNLYHNSNYTFTINIRCLCK